MTTQTPLAWHSNPDLKAEVVARLKAHRAADEFIQGNYQIDDPDAPSGYRGCAIGCTLPPLDVDNSLACKSWHRLVEVEYGIHWRIAFEIDDIFESLLDIRDAGEFAVKVIEAIPVGADLTGVADECRRNLYSDCASQERAARLLIADLAAAPIPALVA